MRDHSRLEELIVADALGGLDPREQSDLARELAAHGPNCAECRRLEAEYRDVAGRLAFALDPTPVRDGLEDETIARALRPELARPRRGRRWIRLVAVAASVALFAAGWLTRDLTGVGQPSPFQTLRNARLVQFVGTGGQLAMAYRPEERGIYLFGSGLQAPPAGRVYELWMIKGSTPTRGACFTPQGEGGTLLTYVDTSLGASKAMAVTVEPSACPSSPTTEPILTATLA